MTQCKQKLPFLLRQKIRPFFIWKFSAENIQWLNCLSSELQWGWTYLVLGETPIKSTSVTEYIQPQNLLSTELPHGNGMRGNAHSQSAKPFHYFEGMARFGNWPLETFSLLEEIYIVGYSTGILFFFWVGYWSMCLTGLPQFMWCNRRLL